MVSYTKKFRVAPGRPLELSKIDPGFTDRRESHKDAAEELDRDRAKLRSLQELLYADGRFSLLICLQGLDAGGKDGTINHILGAMNPQGCSVVGFKEPTRDELAHDFLWRIHQHTPARGRVTIFNRSHYEDVLVVRVHELVPKPVWSRRYDDINAFESALVDADTHILKFFLHISKKEQLRRFKERLDDPAKQWKISESDYKERRFWGDYTRSVRGRPRLLQHEARPLVRDPLRSQMVPEPRHRADRRGASRGAEDEVPSAVGGHRAHPPRIPRGEGEVGWGVWPRSSAACAP